MSPKWSLSSVFAATTLHAVLSPQTCATLSLHHPSLKYIWPRVLKLSEPPHYAFVQPPVNFSPLVPNITKLF